MFNVSNNPILCMPVTFKRNGAVDKVSLFTKKTGDVCSIHFINHWCSCFDHRVIKGTAG